MSTISHRGFISRGSKAASCPTATRRRGAHDAMAAFALPGGNVRLIRNHEDRDPASRSRLKGDARTAYDPKGGGGTTSLEVRPDGDRELVKDFISLNGTIVNCAGGPTPHGSWITCEETTAGETQGFAKDHGYNFGDSGQRRGRRSGRSR